MEEIPVSPAKRIDSRISKWFDDIKTALPGVITKVHKEELKVDVYIKVVKSNRPILIKNVRLLYPQSTSAKILFNVDVGDTVMLIFSKHTLKSLQNEQFVNISEKDRFGMNDVVAIPGVHLDKFKGETLNGVNIEIPDGITIISDDEVLVSGTAFKYHDGSDSYNVISQKDFNYVSSQTEPTVSLNTTTIWTKLDGNNDPIQMFMIITTELGQKKVELA